MDGDIAGIRLPTLDDAIVIKRINLDTKGAVLDALGGRHGSAAAEKKIEYDVNAAGGIEDGRRSFDESLDALLARKRQLS